MLSQYIIRIVRFVIQAPNLAQMMSRMYFLRKVRYPAENPTWLPVFKMAATWRTHIHPLEGLDRCLEGLAICHYNPKVFSTTPQKENQIWALGSPQGANQWVPPPLRSKWMGVSEENGCIIAPPPMGLERPVKGQKDPPPLLYNRLKGRQIQPLASPIVTEFVCQTYIESQWETGVLPPWGLQLSLWGFLWTFMIGMSSIGLVETTQLHF